MNLSNLLRKLFGAGSGATTSDERGVISSYVRCAKCGSIVRVRIRTGSDVSRDDDDVPFVRKVVMDGKCHTRMEMEIKFDDSYRIAERTVQGGEFVSHEQWAAQQHNLK